MARDAFEHFCESAEDETCDEFEKYWIEVLVQNNAVTLVFAHSKTQILSGNIATAFFCKYRSEAPQCFTGRHSYD